MQLMFDAGWTVSRLFGTIILGAKTEGQSNIPKDGAFILAPNHLSYFDPPLVGSFVLRRVHFFAKKELFDVPVLGWILKRINVHPVNRGGFDRKALTDAVKILQAGNPIAVFPEGTRGTREAFLKPKAGIGMIARKAEVPIIPCFVEGTETAGQSLLRKRRIQICYGSSISAEWIKSLPASKEAWLQITDEVMSRLEGMRAELRNHHHSSSSDVGKIADSEKKVDTRSKIGDEVS